MKYKYVSIIGNQEDPNPDLDIPDKISKAERKLSGECIWCGEDSSVPVNRHHADCIGRLKNLAGIK